MNIPTVAEFGDLRKKTILLRLDLNVPIREGVIENNYRIDRSLKTIDFLKKSGARTVIISHIGSDNSESLSVVAKYLKVPLYPLVIDDYLKGVVRGMGDGEVIMLENLRKNDGEKNNDDDFAKKLSGLADIYVNEAFSVSHREHASIVGLPKYLPSFFGFLFKEEIENLSLALEPEHPFVLVLGGAKFSTKLPLIKKFLKIADKIFIGGALANSFLKEMGYETGKSSVDEKEFGLKNLMEQKNIFIPQDVVVDTLGSVRVKDIDLIDKEDIIMDIGPGFSKKIEDAVIGSRFILWNGPLGFFEKGFCESTKGLAIAISKNEIKSIIGGGDTISAVQQLKISDRFTFISSGGGAMIQFLANGSLPGIDAIVG